MVDEWTGRRPDSVEAESDCSEDSRLLEWSKLDWALSRVGFEVPLLLMMGTKMPGGFMAIVMEMVVEAE